MEGCGVRGSTRRAVRDELVRSASDRDRYGRLVCGADSGCGVVHHRALVRKATVSVCDGICRVAARVRDYGAGDGGEVDAGVRHAEFFWGEEGVVRYGSKPEEAAARGYAAWQRESGSHEVRGTAFVLSPDGTGRGCDGADRGTGFANSRGVRAGGGNDGGVWERG